MTSLVVRRLKGKLKLVPVVPRMISEGVVKLERVQPSVLLVNSKLKL